MKVKYSIRPVTKMIVLVALTFFISGCMGNLASKKSDGDTQNDSQPKSKKVTAVYYDFEDILIPMELSIVKGRTVVISTPGFTSGIITLKGRIERQSLFNFFNINMQNDNWNILSQIKSPGTAIMVFQKASRTAVIAIRDEQLNTYVEVGVAPTVSGEAGLSGSSLME
ncbi:MAG: hypothetical protein HN417_03850 [Desulfobacula sp.]|nr:hypothetical protein [Desulfobacula sp.]MBT6338847.1 hypothetical protein [Desulfobacula sp.]MBT7261303.1 hypothetical protein [Desulfobacula sp.]